MSGLPERPAAGRRWLPHPRLTLALALIWVLLQNDFGAGNLLLGLALGLAIPLLTERFGLPLPPLRSYPRAAAYVALVLWDIVVANIHVARLVLFRPLARFHTRWIAVPLVLTRPEAITVLAATITMTPGTVSCDFSADGRTLLVHCLDAPDAEAAVREIKTRYEARLKEIFE